MSAYSSSPETVGYVASALELIRRSLRTAGEVDVFTALPTIVVAPRSPNPGWVRHGEWTAGDAALAVFASLGLRGDRTRLGLHGYPELLRDLSQPAPWIDVEFEDVDGEISTQRENELRPFVEWVLSTPEDELFAMCDEMHRTREARLHHLGLFDAQSASRSPLSAVEAEGLSEFRRDERNRAMRQRIEVGRALGRAPFDSLFEAVFPLDEHFVCAGTPDILVWHPTEPDLWFLSEVKAPGDTLRPEQKAWLRDHWHFLQGHFVLTLLE